MSAILQLLLILAFLIGLAKLGGYLSRQIGQPAVLGELLVGVLLGPTVLNFLGLPVFQVPPNAHSHLFEALAGPQLWQEYLGEIIAHLAEIGVIFLMFIAGMEIDLDTLQHSGRVAVFAGVLGVVLPFIFGAGLALLVGFTLIPALFIGIILTATSVSISAQTLLELGRLRTREGVALLGAAVVDDVLAILIISVFLALIGDGSGGGALGILWVFVRMILYFVGALIVGRLFLHKFMQKVADLPISEGLVSGAVVVMLLYAWSAEFIGGVALITGAFIAGAFLGQSPFHEEIKDGMRTLAYAFFVPIFFINIGLITNGRALSADNIGFVVGLIIVAIAAKVIGSGAGALLGGFDRIRSFRVGIGMISRGEVGLIVASIGINNNIIGQSVFSMTVIIVLVTTLVTPVLLRWVYNRAERRPAEAAASSG